MVQADTAFFIIITDKRPERQDGTGNICNFSCNRKPPGSHGPKDLPLQKSEHPRRLQIGAKAWDRQCIVPGFYYFIEALLLRFMWERKNHAAGATR